jgi:hypothetical protein
LALRQQRFTMAYKIDPDVAKAGVGMPSEGSEFITHSTPWDCVLQTVDAEVLTGIP